MICPACAGTGRVPDPDSQIKPIAIAAQPKLGELFVDPVFGTPFTRVSDARARGVPSVSPEYPTVSAWNADRSRFLLLHHDHFGLYDGSGRFIFDLLIAAGAEPRWSPVDPHWLIYIANGNELWGYSPYESVAFLLWKFEEYGSISGKGESDLSGDGLNLALVGDGREVFIFNHATKKKTLVATTDGRDLDSVMLTSDLRVLLSWRGGGISMGGASMLSLTSANGHKDLCVIDGVDYLVWCSSNEPAWTHNAVVLVDLATGTQSTLLELDPKVIAFNVSCSDTGLALIATYQKPEADWVPYSGELILIDIRTGDHRRLCHHRSNVTDYTSQPKAVISRDGKRALFASNFGGTYVDTYLLEHS